MDIVDNRSRSRFEAAIGEELAIVDYELGDTSIALTHTEVPIGMRNRGIAGTIVRAVLVSARQRGLRVVPRCPYVAAFIRSNPEFQDLLGTAP